MSRHEACFGGGGIGEGQLSIVVDAGGVCVCWRGVCVLNRGGTDVIVVKGSG